MTYKERKLVNRSFFKYYDAIIHFYNRAINTYLMKTEFPNLKEISFTAKNKNAGKNKGQYGFYFTQPHIILDVYDIMKLTNKIKFIDLGCGIGLMQNALKDYFGIHFADGYEIEPSLIQFAKEYLNETHITQKDILTLTAKDIKNYNAIYFWEPLYDDVLCKAFVKNLEKIVNKDQIIIYNSAGKIRDHFEKSKHFELTLQKSPLYVYKKIAQTVKTTKN